MAQIPEQDFKETFCELVARVIVEAAVRSQDHK